MNEKEQESIRYLVRGLRLYATQVERMLLPEDFAQARYAVADRGDEVILVIQEGQTILRSSERE